MTRNSTRRARRRTFVGASSVAIAALAFWGGSAAATVIGQEHYSGTDTYTIADCDGFTLDGESTFHGQALLRADKGGQAFLVKDTYFFHDVASTNPVTGEWFVVEGHGVFHEIKATLVSGISTSSSRSRQGSRCMIVDSNGKVVVRDRGVIRHTVLFDTLGDNQPGGIFLGETNTVVHGPHPGFADDFPFCEIAAELTGA